MAAPCHVMHRPGDGPESEQGSLCTLCKMTLRGIVRLRWAVASAMALWVISPRLLPQNPPGPQPPSAAGKVGSTTAPRFEVFELTLNQAGDYANPYVQVTATATLVPPGGGERSIPLFWDGGRQWKLRFSPDSLGTWSWSVRSSDPGLNDAKGTFECVASTSHGGITTMAGYPYHFQHQDGTPYWLVGDTQWEAFADDPGQGLTSSSVRQYFKLRAEQGFNYVHTEIIGLVRSSNIDAAGREQRAFFDYPAEKINPSYFREVDERVRLASSLGITLGMILLEPYFTPAASIDPAYRYDNVCWMSFRDEVARLRYVRYAVARYSAFNVLFLLTLEWGPNPKPIEKNAAVAMFDRIGAEIQKQDPHGRLRGIHDDNGCLPDDFYGPSSGWNTLGQYAQHSGSDYHFPWCDGCSPPNDENCRGRWATPRNRNTLHNEMLEVRVGRKRGRPVIDAEYAYFLRRGVKEHPDVVNRGHSHDRATFRKAAWVLTMAGTYIVPGFWRTYYGGWAGRNTPFQPDDPEAVPAIKDLQVLHGFFMRLADGSGREWWKLEPHDELVSALPNPADGTPGRAYCLAAPGRSYIVYAENTASAEVQLQGAEGTRYRITRFDPRTADRAALSPTAKSDTRVTLKPPDTEDWVFEIQSE